MGVIFYCWRLTPFSLNSWGNNKNPVEVEKYWVVARIIFSSSSFFVLSFVETLGQGFFCMIACS